MQAFRCSHCQTTVFFDNFDCTACGCRLGFVPGCLTMRAFSPSLDAGDGIPAPWPAADDGPALRPCANRAAYGACNWMLDADDPAALCRSCRLTRVLPALDQGPNLARWQVIERAKRRLVFTLLGLGLAPQPKQGPDDAQGLDFLLLEEVPGGPPVHTGHDRGTITLNVAEADDDRREAQRVRLGEPVRNLLGHLRHEAAHYLQYRWIDSTPAAEVCRAAFGDETQDYAAALARHYAQGAPVDWPLRFISAYASAHPWEDWAETCAHYLLVIDAVHQLVLQHWLPLAQFLNAMDRSLGHRDSYPFLLPPPVLDKLATVQQLLQAVRLQ